jgi:hypothetical protein
MHQLTKSFSLSACALAASLLISACGGGDATDGVAPTVAITSETSAGGTMTFTFKFSESVGNSFAIEDLVVPNGTPSNFTKSADGLTYTVDVTGATGAVSVTLPAGKVFDAKNNPNLVDVSFSTEPLTAAPTPPARIATDVLSIYSDSYTPIAGIDYRPGWGQSTAVNEVTLFGNKTEKYTDFNYEGITFTPIDASSMTHLHIDVWTPDLSALTIFIMSDGDKESKELKPTKAGWNSFDIDMSTYASVNKAAVKEMKLVATGGTTLYFDNLYFWKAASAVSSACTGTSCIDFSGSGIGFGVFENYGGGTAEIANDPSNSANKLVKFVKKAADAEYFGTTITGLGGSVVLTAQEKTVTMRVWSPAVGTNFLLKFEGGTGGPANIEKDVVTTKAGEWETLSFVMTDAGTFSTVVVFPHGRSKVTADTTMYIDDLKFPAFTASASVDNTFTGGIFAGNYLGSLDPADNNQARTALGGNVGFFYDSRLAKNVGAVYDYGGLSGYAQNAGGVPNFYYGLGLKLPAITDGYFGAYVNAPGNGTVDVSSFTNILVNVWGPDQLFKAGAFPALEVVLNGPAVTGCASNSGGSEVTNTFTTTGQGADKVYTLPLSAFTVKHACSGETSVAQVLAKIKTFNISILNSNIQYINKDNDGVGYTNGLNMGAIKFN